MAHSYEESKKIVFKGMILLGVITIIEVMIALVGNGHVIHGFHLAKWIMYPLMIGFSLYKAYFIVYEFMHMRYEVKTLALSVLMPTLLLVWALIAFFQEGTFWGSRRSDIEQRNAIPAVYNPNAGVPAPAAAIPADSSSQQTTAPLDSTAPAPADTTSK